MARPKANTAGPTARERMIGAFWTMLEEKPFARISVADIARTAEVNRNAFYYHFDNMEDLARKAIAEHLPVELFQSLMPQLAELGTPPESVILNPVNEANFAKVRLLAGPHGSFELARIAKESAIGTWLGLLGLAREDLTRRELASLAFVAGGLFEILGAGELLDGADHPLQELWGSPIVASSLSSIPVLFSAASARKRG